MLIFNIGILHNRKVNNLCVLDILSLYVCGGSGFSYEPQLELSTYHFTNDNRKTSTDEPVAAFPFKYSPWDRLDLCWKSNVADGIFLDSIDVPHIDKKITFHYLFYFAMKMEYTCIYIFNVCFNHSWDKITDLFILGSHHQGRFPVWIK